MWWTYSCVSTATRPRRKRSFGELRSAPLESSVTYPGSGSWRDLRRFARWDMATSQAYPTQQNDTSSAALST